MNNKVNLYSIPTCKDCIELTKHLTDACEFYNCDLNIIDVDEDPLVSIHALRFAYSCGCYPKMFPFFIITNCNDEYADCYSGILDVTDVNDIIKKYERPYI